MNSDKRHAKVLSLAISPTIYRAQSANSPWRAIAVVKGRLTGGFQTGGFPDLDLSFLFCPFSSFLGLSRFFWDFPDFLGDGPGIFPICPFPLSRPIKSTYEEQSRKGPRHNLDLSRKKWETPGFGKPPGLASLKARRGSYKTIFLLNSRGFSLERREIQELKLVLLEWHFSQIACGKLAYEISLTIILL